MLTAIQQPFFVVVFILLGICMIACLIAAIRGPELGDPDRGSKYDRNIDDRHHLPSFLRIAAKLAIGCGVDLHHDQFSGSRCIDTYFYTSLQKPCQRAGERIMRWNGFVLLPQRSVSVAVYL